MEWISVKDSLPEVGKRVLIYTRGYIYESKLEVTTNWHVANTIVEGRLLRWSYFLGCRYNIVSHWMPLPEPPKE